jgi:hypothetical protein
MTGKQPRCPAGSEGINKLVSPDDGGKLNRKKKSLSHGNSWRIVSAHRQMKTSPCGKATDSEVLEQGTSWEQ